MTALQLSETKDISEFIESKLNKLQSAHRDDKSIIQPLPKDYNKLLSKNRRKYYVPMLECEKFLFYVSLLLQVYLRENMLTDKNALTPNVKKFCTNCITDVGCVENLSQHLTNLEKHVQLLSRKQDLSQLCQLYITSMKMCIP